MDDLIYRQAAIEACNQQTTDCNPDHFNGHEHFTEFLDDATIGSFGKWQFANGFNVGVMAARIAIKNIDPAQRWIPVTERPPEDYQKVLVFWWEHSEPMIDTAFWQKDAKRFEGHHWVRMEDKVTHWMPQPLPPKEEAERV